MQLWIGNKNYSSWSMRPWVVMRHFDLPFEEKMVRFDSFAPDSNFKTTLRDTSPTGKVPVLVDGEMVVWDTLAIAETLAERFPHLPLWPVDPVDRALARSLCAEMHAGFGTLRQHCPQNLEAHLPEVGQRLLQAQAGLRADLTRLGEMWTQALMRSQGPFLLGEFGIVDAYFAPVLGRIRTYQLPLPPDLAAYADRVWAVPAVVAWVSEALAEQDFLDFEEPYRSAR
jgi:glutathione S-transferase